MVFVHVYALDMPARFNFEPILPCRNRVLDTFKRVARSRIGTACLADLLGSEIAELAVKGEALTVASLMDDSTSDQRKMAYIDAVMRACDIATMRVS